MIAFEGEMPKGCGVCPLAYLGEDDECIPVDLCVLTGKYVWNDFMERAEDCPLVEVERMTNSNSLYKYLDRIERDLQRLRKAIDEKQEQYDANLSILRSKAENQKQKEEPVKGTCEREESNE